jgi:methionyl-tRNA synthetase
MTIYITTPIFYASGEPHLGHAYSGFIADTLKRYYTLKGEEVRLITGTDEHGQKIEKVAAKDHVSVQQCVDAQSAGFRHLWQSLDITPDEFVRTTDISHYHQIQTIWKKLYDKGDIYLGTYAGKYCIDCEQYISEWQLENNRCPIHRREVETTHEPTYLFRLEGYRKKLLAYYNENTKFIKPKHFRTDVLNYLSQPLEDLSVSRVNTQWGIPVPNDAAHVVYVWLDALFSYLTAIEKNGGDQYALQQTIHVVGKDILQFHSVYWPAFLLALDYPLPKHLIVHGWWTIEGEKISKSNPTTLIKPGDLAEKVSTDALRYALLKHKPLERDGDLRQGDLIQTVNSDLANNFGNLVKRHASLVYKRFDGVLKYDGQTISNASNTFIANINHLLTTVDLAYTEYQLQKVCLTIDKILHETNGYFHQRAPWSSDAKQCNIEETLLVVHAVLEAATHISVPILHQLCERIALQLNFKLSRWPETVQLGNIHASKPKNVFSRLDED